MLDSSAVLRCSPSRNAGWSFEVGHGNETHSKMTSGNHKVFNAGKPLIKFENVDDPVVALTEAGIL
jgi:hypothetical protein